MPQLQIFLAEDNQVTHDLAEEKITVGRLADNTIQIDDGSVSSRHAEIALENGKYHLHDLGSTNGTFVNNEQVTDAVLSPGDEVRFGRVESVFGSEDEDGESQPLPESHDTAVKVASQSARPVDFVSSSPVPKGAEGKDPVAGLLYGVAGLAIVAFAAAVYFVFAMQQA